MKTKKWHRLFCVLALMAAVSIMSGCGGKAETKGNGKLTQLKMYLIGDKPEIYDNIYSEVNNMLRKDIGAQLDIEYLNWGDYSNRYNLLFAANEAFDLAFSATWVSYVDQARKGGFYELTDEFIKKNAPKTYETVPQEAWKQTKIMDKIYMVPNTGMEINSYVVGLRGDLRKKYNLGEIETTDDLNKYLVTVAENEKELIAWPDVYQRLWFLLDKPKLLAQTPGVKIAGDTLVETYKYIVDTDTKEFVNYNYIDTDEYKQFLLKTRELASKGVWPQDIISNKTTKTMFENGKSATICDNIETVSEKLKRVRGSHPEWEVELHSFVDGRPKCINPYINNGLSIHATSKNPEKAMQVIELLRNDERYYNLTWYGIKGTHWDDAAEAGYYNDLNSKLPDNEKYKPGCTWGWKNDKLNKRSNAELKESRGLIQKWLKQDVVIDPLQTFSVSYDQSKFKNEIAAAKNVEQQYGRPLAFGMISDIDRGIKQYRDYMTQTGIEAMIKDWSEAAGQYLKNTD